MIKNLLKEILLDEFRTKPEIEISEYNGVKTIVILQRGWVVVGDYFSGSKEDRLENASVIRRWGTSKGVGELALEGPKPETKLDDCGVVRFNKGAEVCRIDCNPSKW